MSTTAPKSEPRISTAGLSMLIGDRAYATEDFKGADHFKHLLEMPTPPAVEMFYQDILQGSQLLKLGTVSSDDEIYAAYGHDLTLLNGRRADLKKTVDLAVESRTSSDVEQAKAFLAEMVKRIDRIVHEPQMNLGADTLKQYSGAALLQKLKDEFVLDAESLKEAVVIWLHSLAENDYVSVIERFSPTSLRYHFFKIEAKREQMGEGTVVHDPGISVSGRMVEMNSDFKVDVCGVRRSHTVVGTKTNPLSQYGSRVPKRIAELINNIPASIKPYVSVIDGTVTEELTVTQLAQSQVVNENHSVWKPDPVLALFGEYALAGWGGTNSEPASSVFAGHLKTRADRFLIGSAIAVLVLSAAVEPFMSIRGSMLVFCLGAFFIFLHQLTLRVGNRS